MGSYPLYIALSSKSISNSRILLPVTINIKASPITVSPDIVTFNRIEGARSPQRKQLQFTVDPAVTYSVTSSAPWFTVSPASATGNAIVELIANPGGLDAGTYNAAITVSSASITLIPIPVTIIIKPPPTIKLTPASLSFFGQSGGMAPTSRIVSATLDPAGGSVRAVAASTGWLGVGPSSNGGDFNVSISTSGLAPGSYTGAVIFSADGAGSKSVPVTLTVTATEPTLFLAGSDKLAFFSKFGEADPPQQTLYLTAKGKQFKFTAAANSIGGWLRINSGSGLTPVNLKVFVNATGLNPGTYSGSIVFASPEAVNTPYAVPVTLTVTGVTGLVVNYANFKAGPVAPGSRVAVFGSFPVANSERIPYFPDASVKVNGITARLYNVSLKQLDLQVPQTVKPGAATMIVNAGGLDSAPIEFTVAIAAPAIYADSQKRLLTISHTKAIPAPAGSVILVYFNGIGPVDNGIPPGSVGASLDSVIGTMPLTAILGGKPCEVLFSGLTDRYAGLALAMLRVPQGLAAGDYQLTLTIAGVTSDWVWVSVN